MKNLKIVVKSNNKKSITQLMCYLNEKLKTNKFILQKICLKILNKHQFTILKSPNINKTAQEKFEKKNFNIQIMSAVTKFICFLYFLKQLSQSSSPDCCVFLKYKIICQYNPIFRRIIFNSGILKTSKYSNKTMNNAFFDFSFFKKSKALLLLKLFSISGEFFKKQ